MAVIGINIGKANSISCMYVNNGTKYIPNSDGEYITPTQVGFDNKGRCIVGKEVSEMNFRNEQNVFMDFMDSIGTSKKFYLNDNGVTIKEYVARDLASFVIRSIKLDAYNYIGEEETGVILSVPAYFDEEQRLDINKAAERAGVNVIKIVSIPLAIMLDYKMQTRTNNKKYCVVDFGAKTIEISVLEVVDNEITMLGSVYENIGGDKFEDYIEEDFYRRNAIRKEELPDRLKKIIRNEAKLCKLELTNASSSIRTINIGGKQYYMTMDNNKLATLSKDMFDRIAWLIKKVLNDTYVLADDVDKYIATGGGCMMPIVKSILSDITYKKMCFAPQSDKLVANGLVSVIENEVLKEKTNCVTLNEMCPFSIGIELYDGSISAIIDRNDTLPCSRIKYYDVVLRNENKVSFNIYRGENLRAYDNTYMGCIEFQSMDFVAGNNFSDNNGTRQIEIGIRFTYDIRGILDVDVVCLENGKQIHKTIINSNICMNEQEVLNLLNELESIKVHPKYLDKYKRIITRAEKAYSCSNSLDRKKIKQVLNKFEEALDEQKDRLIRNEYKNLLIVLDMVENNNLYLE